MTENALETTVLVTLRGGIQSLIDKDDLPVIERYVHHFNKRHGYACCNVGPNGHTHPVPFHKMIINAPKGMYIDHINGNRLDNRRCNLRLVTPSMSRVNSAPKRNSKSGYKGVVWHNQMKRWGAQIGVYGKVETLGWFDDPADAARAYDAKAKEIYGEYARQNFS